MQFTQRRTIGGRAWLSISLPSVEHEKAIVAWANTTLGLLSRWWHSNKQQNGRGNIGKSTLETLPILDVTMLPTEQLANAVKIFDDMCQMPLLPIHEIDKDPVRTELDERFALEVLGIAGAAVIPDGPIELLRRKLAKEPSIRGRK